MFRWKEGAGSTMSGYRDITVQDSRRICESSRYEVAPWQQLLERERVARLAVGLKPGRS
jgi:hypothetical protein